MSYNTCIYTKFASNQNSLLFEQESATFNVATSISLSKPLDFGASVVVDTVLAPKPNGIKFILSCFHLKSVNHNYKCKLTAKVASVSGRYWVYEVCHIVLYVLITFSQLSTSNSLFCCLIA